MIVLNDIHLGTKRQAGTTPLSQSSLGAFIRSTFRDLVLADNKDDHLVINGDLFDGFMVEPSEVIEAANVIMEYLERDNMVTLGAGNHDWSPKAGKVSSFHLLAYILRSRFPGRVNVIDASCGLTLVDKMFEAWMIPHMPNQDLFDLEIEKAAAAKVSKGYLFLHCNVMSPFAEHSDHSLNLSEEQVEALVEAGWTIVVAHEHQARYVHGKRVIVTGNQIPSSVADCRNNPANKKQRMRITREGWVMEDVLDLDLIYAEIDWAEIDQTDLDGKLFIRVGGNCTAEQSADMVNAIAKLRQHHDAYVISNAVKVDGIAQMEGLADLTMENINKFDVLAALLEELDEREQKVVKELLA